MAEDGGNRNEGFTPWRDGNYCSKDGYFQLLKVTGEKALSLTNNKQMTFKHGQFGEASENIVKRSGGEKTFTIELRFEAVGKEFVNLGVLLDNGRKFIIETILGIWTFNWVTEEEMDRLLNDGDPITAPDCPHKAEPERLGRLIWITGAPALGKSTTAQLLSREHGYVYYEADCFFQLRNPYIPADVENPSLAAAKQRKLVGEGVKERRALSDKNSEVFRAKLAGKKDFKMADQEAAYGELCKDIARERARIGGDWAIAALLDSRRIRDFVRSELGPDLEIVVLQMTPEEQVARIRARHEGTGTNSEDAVDYMKGFMEFWENAEPGEPKTLGIKVTPEMTPRDIVATILEGSKNP